MNIVKGITVGFLVLTLFCSNVSASETKRLLAGASINNDELSAHNDYGTIALPDQQNTPVISHSNLSIWEKMDKVDRALIKALQSPVGKGLCTAGALALPCALRNIGITSDNDFTARLGAGAFLTYVVRDFPLAPRLASPFFVWGAGAILKQFGPGVEYALAMDDMSAMFLIQGAYAVFQKSLEKKSAMQVDLENQIDSLKKRLDKLEQAETSDTASLSSSSSGSSPRQGRRAALTTHDARFNALFGQDEGQITPSPSSAQLVDPLGTIIVGRDND